MIVDVAAPAAEFAALERIPHDFDSRAEAEHVAALFAGPLAELLSSYQDPRAEGAGGSGIVVSATYVPFATRRAIKVPRNRSFQGTAQDALQPFVDPELQALSKVSHKNITRLYDSRPLPDGRGWCTITEYVEGPTPQQNPPPLDIFASRLCCSEACRRNDLLRAQSLRTLAGVVFEIADAFMYMHDTASLLHFDIKPDNILVSRTMRPFVTDLGFARDLKRYAANDTVSIGFTWKYAHPDLTDPHHGARVSRSPAKARNEIFGSELRAQLDVFAFGRTLQEVLHGLHEEHGDSIYSDYVFNYLHLIACLCLDGHNAPDNADRRRDTFVSDTALGMPTDVYIAHRFSTFSHIRMSLERLLGYRRLEDDLPETDRWSSATLYVSDLGITTLTPRVNSILQHPTFQRLSSEYQLGMLDTVFPTATHSRLQHSLGVFHAVTSYITALYYDPDNPVFRAIFSAEDCKRALVASLVHDVGQTTFGHELEEIDRKEFSHETIGGAVLNHDNAVDGRGRRLLEILEGNGIDEWGTPLSEVSLLWSRTSQKPVDAVYHDVVNGQLDADKLDYLIRDSTECRIAYGSGMDTERFLRSLTTCATANSKLRLAIKQKGAASAEAFFFARYQLYQSLYWHHTFRAIKSMFLTSSYVAFEDIRKKCQPEMFAAFRTAYMKHVLGLADDSPPESVKSSSAQRRPGKVEQDTIANYISRAMATSEQPGSRGKYSKDPTLVFLWKVATAKSRTMLEDIMARNYYKRVLELPLSSLREESWLALRERFTGANRIQLQNTVDEKLSALLRKSIQDRSTSHESLRTDRALERFHEITARKWVFTIDLPLRGWYASGDEPLFVSDYKRRHFRTAAGSGALAGTLWSDHLGDLMRRIAFVRIFCEPDAHKLLTRVLTADAMELSICDVLPELQARKGR